MNTFGLLRIADRNAIPVYDFKMIGKKAFCTEHAIAIDFQSIDSERESKRLLAEELGHVMSKALYPLSYCCDSLRCGNVKKMERKAKNCAIRLTVPLGELKTAIADGIDDNDIADRLDIELWELSEAIEFYKTKRLL